MKFVNTTTGIEEELDNESSKLALANPQYLPTAEHKTFSVKAEDGTTYESDDINKARAFVQNGYGSFVTPFDREKERWDKKGIVGDVAAFGLGLLSSTTFGGADVAARAFGVGETWKAVKEASPIPAVAGEMASYALPFAGEAKLAALAAKGGAKLGGKIAARKSEAKLAELIAKGEISEGTTIAAKTGSLLVKAGEAVARGGTIGLRQGITDVSLDDIPLTVEAAGAQIGKDILMGGALDLGFTMGAPAIRKAVEKGWSYVPGSSTASDAVNRALAKAAAKMPFGSNDEEALFNLIKKDTRKEYNDFAANFEKNVGTTTESLTQLRDGYAKKATEKLVTARDEFKVMASRDPQLYETMLAGMKSIQEDTKMLVADEVLSGKMRGGVSRIRAIIDQVQDDTAALAQRVSTPKEASKAIDDFFDSRSLAKEVMKSLKEKFQTETISKKFDIMPMSDLIKKFEATFDAMGQTAAMKESDRLYATSKQLEEFLSAVSSRKTKKINPVKVTRLLKSGKIGDTPIDEFIATIMRDEGVLSSSLGNGSTNAANSLQHISDMAAMSKRLKAISSATGQFTGRSLMPAVAGFGMGGIGVGGAAIGAALTPLLNPTAYLKAVDAVENMASKFSKSMMPPNKAQHLLNAQGLGQKVIEAVKDAIRTRKTMMLDDAAMGVYEAMKSRKNLEEHINKLNDFTGTETVPQFQKLEKMHPQLPGRAAEQYGMIQTYLQQNVPRMRQSFNKPNETRMPTSSEIQNYTQKMVAALDPWGTLQRAASKGAQPSNIALGTIRDLYPKMYSQIVDKMPGTEVGGIDQIQNVHEIGIEEPGQETSAAPRQRKANFSPVPLTSIQRATMR